MMKWILSVLVVAFFSFSNTFARDYFVGGAGAADSNPGTAAQPFATIQRAATVAVSGDVVYIRSGTYRETIIPASSGVTFRNDAGAVATISGLNAVTTPWTSHTGQIYRTSITLPVNGFQQNLTSNTTILANQVFKDGVMQFQARWPKMNSLDDLINRDKFRHHSQTQGLGRNSVTDSGLPNGNFTGASIFVTGWFISETRQITSQNGKTLNYSALNENGKFQRWYYIINDLELLTQAKEWHYENGTLYFWQEGGGAPSGVEYKARNWGFDLRGKDNTQIIGLHFIGCEPATGDTGTDGTVIDNIRARYNNHAFITATNGDFNYYNAKQVGIKLLGSNNTIKNSEFKYVSSQVIWASNGTVVENNLCTDIGWEGNYGAFVTPWGTSGGNIKINRNTAYRLGRSAVDFGHGTHPNIEVGYNHFHTFSMVTSDVGATYGCCGVQIPGTRIHHNWIHDNMVRDGWKTAANFDGIHVNIYFDQGAGPATVDHNVLWNGSVADAYSEIKNGVLTNWYNNTFGSTGSLGERESYFCPHDTPNDVFRNNIFQHVVNINWKAAQTNDNPTQPGDVLNSLFRTTNPNFVGPINTGLGYKLQPNSPAINAGVVIPGITEGSVGAPDAGAYEYGAPDWIPGYVPLTTNPVPNTPPVVSITAPANNTSVAQGTAITLNATASDANGTISRVEFFNGTTKLGEDTSSPYSFTWNNAPAGTHTITARATDNANATVTSSPISITVTANAAPSVGITAPANNSVIAAGNPVTITATASDANGTITLVEFFDGTTKLGEDATSPYSFTWNNPANGSHSLTARATDDDNGTTTSAAVAITIGAANTPPTVSITSPANNAQFTAGANVTLTANAADANGTVSKVEFYNGTTKLGEDLTAPYSLPWNNVPAGTHSLTARATDNGNLVTNSTAISITVTGANAPPVVSLTSPSNNAQFAAGVAINITAVATDANGTVTRVEFFDGSTKLGEDLTSPYSFRWNNPPAGSHTITARATDNGNLVTNSSAVTVTVGTPNTPPTVALTSPANNAQFTSGATITITANASDANGTVTKVEFFAGTTKLGEDISSPYSFIWTNAPNGSHVLTARATDNGNVVTTSTSISIAINPNNAPAVAITAPLNNAEFLSGSSITIGATATDANGTITKVEFYDGAKKLGEDLTSPYSFIWTNVPAGTYFLNVKATDNLGVVGTSNTITIIVINPAAPTVNAGEDVFLTFPENSTTLTPSISSNLPVEYSWTQVEGPNTASISDPTTGSVNLNDLVEGTYVFELLVTSTNGLSTTDRVTITVTGGPDGETPVAASQSGIPRFFTPNDDGTGDYWEWQDPESFQNSMLTVFNRSGQKIYEALSYNNNWDGKLDGQPLQAGDYYYVIKLPDLTDLRGAVRIIR